MGHLYEVAVEGDSFTVPNLCTCCLGPADKVQVVTHSTISSSGVVYQQTVRRDTAFGFPICGECLRHQKMYDNKEFNWVALSALTSILMFFVMADLIVAISVDMAPLLLLGGMLTLVLTVGYSFLVRLGVLGDAHACRDKAVEIRDASFRHMRCRFHNYKYAEAFAAANNTTITERKVRGQSRNRSLLSGQSALAIFVRTIVIALIGQFVVVLMRYDVSGSFTSQAVLAEIALRSSEWHFRNYAVRRLTDQALLVKVAIKAGDDRSTIGQDVVEKLADQALLETIAQKGEDRDVRRAAIEKLTNQALLETIAQKGEDSVWAELRLSELRRTRE